MEDNSMNSVRREEIIAYVKKESKKKWK